MEQKIEMSYTKFGKLSTILLALLSVTLLLAINAVNVEAAGIVSIISVSSASGNPGDTVNINVTINNTGDANISSVNLASSALVSGSSSISAPSISALSNLNTNSTPQVKTFSLTIPTVPAGTYTGTVNASFTGGNTDSKTYTVTVNSLDKLDVTSDVTLASLTDKTATQNVTVKNIGSTTLSNFALNFIQSSFSDGLRNVTLSVASGSIAPGETKNLILSAKIPVDIKLGKYSGSVNLTSGTATDLFNLDVVVRPDLCSRGKVGKIVIDSIREPSSGDKFKPLENIPVEVRVRNNNNEDLDIEIEVFLIDQENDEIVAKALLKTEINENELEDYELTLKVPADIEKESDSRYDIYVKVSEEDEEEDHCDEKNTDVKIKKDKNKVVVEKTEIPEVLTCGAFSDVSVKVVNAGKTKEKKVKLVLDIPTLSVKEKSVEFGLDEADDKNVLFSFRVPENSLQGDHQANFIILDEDDSVLETLKATVITKPNCRVQITLRNVGALSREGTRQLLIQGEEVSFTVKGNPHKAKIESISGTSVTVTLSSDPQTLNFVIGESKKVDIDNDGILDIEVLVQAVTADGKADVVLKELSEIPTPSTPPSGVTGQVVSPLAVSKDALPFVIVDIILIIAVIVLVVILLSRRRETRAPRFEVETRRGVRRR